MKSREEARCSACRVFSARSILKTEVPKYTKICYACRLLNEKKTPFVRGFLFCNGLAVYCTSLSKLNYKSRLALLLQQFIDTSYALATTYAGGYHAVLLTALAQLVEQLNAELSARAAKRVAERNSATIHVQLALVDT